MKKGETPKKGAKIFSDTKIFTIFGKNARKNLEIKTFKNFFQ